MDEQPETPTFFEMLILFGFVMLVIVGMIFVVHKARARDIGGKYAQQDPERHEWFESLQNQEKSYCCAEADGMAVADGDWGTEGGAQDRRYWVVVPSNLDAPRSSEPLRVEVPSEALVRQANRIGTAMVWPMHKEGGIAIRCFMPGTLS